jgi:hypothetical protein
MYGAVGGVRENRDLANSSAGDSTSDHDDALCASALDRTRQCVVASLYDGKTPLQ